MYYSIDMSDSAVALTSEIAVTSAGTQPVVSVDVGLSSREIIPWSKDIHHLGCSFSSPEINGFGSTFPEIPAFGGFCKIFPMIRLHSVEVSWRPKKLGAGIVTAMTIAGAAMTPSVARGKKQRYVGGANQMNLYIVQKVLFSFGDGLAAQVQPVSATGVQPYFYLHLTGESECTVDIYFQSAGPMDKVVVWSKPTPLGDVEITEEAEEEDAPPGAADDS